MPKKVRVWSLSPKSTIIRKTPSVFWCGEKTGLPHNVDTSEGCYDDACDDGEEAVTDGVAPQSGGAGGWGGRARGGASGSEGAGVGSGGHSRSRGGRDGSVGVELRAGIGDAVGCSGDDGGEGSGIASSGLVVTIAGEEDTGGIGSGHVEVATFGIVDVLAIIRVRDRVIASLEAELVASDEAVPVVDLGDGSLAGGQVVGEDQTTERVSGQISTVGIEFSSRVVRGEADSGLVEETGDLDVSWGLDELHSSKRTASKETSAVAWLRAVCDDLSLDVSDNTIRGR